MNDYGTARAFDNPERVAENLSKPRTRRVDWVRSVVNLLVGLSLLQIVRAFVCMCVLEVILYVHTYICIYIGLPQFASDCVAMFYNPQVLSIECVLYVFSIAIIHKCCL